MSKKQDAIEENVVIQPENNKDLDVCGVVMPISSIEDCNEAHWANVYEIIKEAVYEAGYEANIVSFSDDVGVIQKKIVQNLYDNPIVVVDISAKNPNVMFELGLRLAFDKPTIIIKDDKTGYPFDTSIIEHITYPRDLRYQSINLFKEKLTKKITATVKASKEGNYTTFLKHFGTFQVAQLDTIDVSGAQFLMEQLKEIKQEIVRMKEPTKPKTVFIGEEVIEEMAKRIVNSCINSDKINKNTSFSELEKELTKTSKEMFGILPDIQSKKILASAIDQAITKMN